MPDFDAKSYIITHWQIGESVKAIRVQLLMLDRDYSEGFILNTIRVYLDDASENAKINPSKL